MLGEVFDGRYRIDALLGEGGIGTVYEAEHLALGRKVALKVLLPEHEGTLSLRKRFEREAKALSALNHPHIVAITDVGVANDTPYLVMELLEGSTLAKRMEEAAVEPARAIAMTRQILDAMAYAHERDIAHRDLKPQNVFVRRLGDGTDHVTVLDFGLVRFLDEEGRAGTQLTRQGALLGTPAYMAPEQAAGGAVDARADVYAAGLILYELLAGRRPFTTRNASELRRAHIIEPPPRLHEADPRLEVVEELEDLVARALAKDPSDRFANAVEMLAAIDELPETTARRVSPHAKRGANELPTPDPTADTVAAAPGARVAPPPVEAPRLGRRRLGVVVAIAAVGFIALGGIVAAIAMSMFEGAEPTTEERAPGTVPPPLPELVPGAVVAPPADPLADLPSELAPIHAKIAAGRPLSRAEIGSLRRYGREHASDPRAQLLLGRHFTSVRSLSWAIPEYEEACRRDPNARRWAPMLEDLLEMAVSGSLHERATRLIVDSYGEEAVPVVEAQLAVVRRREESRRLEALLARLRSQR